MSVTAYHLDKDKELVVIDDPPAIADLPQSGTLWLDVKSDDLNLMNELADHFGHHELAIEDCLTPGHYPKLEDYGSYLFLIFRGLFFALPELNETMEEEIEEEEHTRAISIFLSDRFIITHRMKEVPWLNAVGRQITQIPESTIAAGSFSVAHRVIDVLIDRFTRGLNPFEEKIEGLEKLAIEDPDEFEIAMVYDFKRELATLRHIMRDQKAVITRLAQESQLVKDKQLRRYFRDIEDHASVILATIDKQVEATVGVRDVYFAMANVRLGDIMRILAVITTIGVPMQLVVGMYGMNFDLIPLSHDPYGFWMIMGAMTLLAILMLFFFRRKHWI